MDVMFPEDRRLLRRRSRRSCRRDDRAHGAAHDGVLGRRRRRSHHRHVHADLRDGRQRKVGLMAVASAAPAARTRFTYVLLFASSSSQRCWSRASSKRLPHLLASRSASPRASASWCCATRRPFSSRCGSGAVTPRPSRVASLRRRASSIFPQRRRSCTSRAAPRASSCSCTCSSSRCRGLAHARRAVGRRRGGGAVHGATRDAPGRHLAALCAGLRAAGTRGRAFDHAERRRQLPRQPASWLRDSPSS